MHPRRFAPLVAALALAVLALPSAAHAEQFCYGDIKPMEATPERDTGVTYEFTCREPVTWNADHGGTLADDVTSPNPCDASNRWTLGPDPGSQTVTATAAPGVSATFSATASP